VKKFLQSWLVNTLAVLVAVYVLRDKIIYEKPIDLIVASLLLGILNAVIRPVLMFLTLPLLIVTLGLFLLVINACVLYFVGYVMRPHFYVTDFLSAFWGALIISIISLILNTITGTGTSRIRVEKRHSTRGSDRDSGGGPVIDV